MITEPKDDGGFNKESKTDDKEMVEFMIVKTEEERTACITVNPTRGMRLDIMTSDW